MKTRYVNFACLSLFVFFANANRTVFVSTQNTEKIQKPSMSFTENKGQVHDQHYKPRPDVLYGVMAGNMAVHIKKSGVSYQLYRVDSYKEVDPVSEAMGNYKNREQRKGIDQQTIYRIDLNWLNHNTNFTKSEDEALPGYNNYYFESCPEGALNVKSYKGITLNNIYNGINLHYYEKNGELKHDYIVAPHADYKHIQLLVEGAEVSIGAGGSLILKTPLGNVQEGAPIVYQNGRQLKAKWIIKSNILSFEIENYDNNQELIIDPITRLWGTYYGGTSVFNGTDYGYSCATDLSDNVYLAGHTVATGTVIATVGSHQISIAGSDDAFLVKFNSNGFRLWGTYYGGSGTETGTGCTTDPAGSVYLTGLTGTTSGNLIATAGTQQTSHAGGTYDGYLVKFNSNGVRQWGTYCGGSGTDYPQSCAFSNGGIYMAGTTSSSNGFSTPGSHQPTAGGGTNEAFLVKFNPTNGTRLWGTFYGGAADDRGFYCTTDKNGNVYMSGYSGTNTGVIIATPGSHQPAPNGNSGAYLVKFNSNGVRLWGTYYGYPGDFGLCCATDATGNVYMSGYTHTVTNTGSVVATSSAHQNSHGGQLDAFLVKLNSNGVRQWGTYYGGSEGDIGQSCVADAAGNVYLGGITGSGANTVISTPGSHQTAYAGGTVDVFVAKFDGNGVRISGTYYGGAGYEYGGYLALNATGHLYASGFTGSTAGNVIATPGSHQSAFGGTPYDAFLVKFDACDAAPLAPLIIGPGTVCVAAAYTYSTPVTAGAHSYTWSLPSGWAGNSLSNILFTIPGSSGVFSLVTQNLCGTSPQQTINVTVSENPTVTVNSGTLCFGETFTLVANGANTYTFSSGPVVSPTITSSYSVVGTDAIGCVSSNTAVSILTVSPLPIITAVSSRSVICVGEEAVISAVGLPTYTFNPGGIATSITVTPIITTSYTISGTDASGCSNTATFTQVVDACTGLNSEILNHTFDFIKLYPNPTCGEITLELNAKSEVYIINTLGQIVYSTQLNAGNHQINLQSLSNGIYVLKCGDSKNYKLIKE